MADKVIGFGSGDFEAFPSDAIIPDATVTPGGAIVDVENNTTSDGPVYVWNWELRTYPAGAVTDTDNAELPSFTGPYAAGEYQIALVATNKYGRTSEEWLSDPFTIGTVAQIPELTLTVTGPAGINVAWTFAGNTVEGTVVEIERATAEAGPFSNINDSDVDDGEYDDSGLTAATQYFYRARSRAPGGQVSEYSTVENATTSAAAVPVAPATATVAETSRTALTVTYDFSWAAVSGATSYDYWIEASTDGGFSNGSSLAPIANIPGTSVSGLVVDRQAINDETVFVVAARNASGQGATKRKAEVVPGNLRAPVLNSVIASGTSGVFRYTEDPEADTADQYEVQVDGVTVSLETPGASQPQHSEPNLSVGSHTGRVRAVDTDVVDRVSLWSVEKPFSIGGSAPAGYDAGQDFRTLTGTVGGAPSNLNPGFSIINAANILYDDGTYVLQHTGQASGYNGLLYRFQEKSPATGFNLAQICNDQSLTTKLFHPFTLDLYVEAEIVFSSNWDLVNPLCTSPSPDYKTILAYPKPNTPSGEPQRADYHVGNANSKISLHGLGGNNLSCCIPKNVWTTGQPTSALSVRDGLPHTYRVHFKLEQVNGIWTDVMQSSVDGVLQHSMRGLVGYDIGTRMYREIKLGANRNLGAYEEMYVHWLQFYAWTSGNPQWEEFETAEIEDYTCSGCGVGPCA